MSVWDYQSIVGRGSDLEPDARAYVLRLGSIELEPISYASLCGLRDCRSAVRELLDLCFASRPVMWSLPGEVHPGSFADRLREIEVVLSAVRTGLDATDRPGCAVLSRLVELWQERTREGVRRLEADPGPGVEASADSVLWDYRRSAFAFVEALLQLLPAEEYRTCEARRKLDEGKAGLLEFTHSSTEQVETAGWRRTGAVETSDDRTFVTWGIP